MGGADELQVHLSEEQGAVRRHQENVNAAVLWRLAVVAGTISLGVGLLSFALARPWPMAAALGNAALLVVVYLKSDSRLLADRFRAVCIAFLLLQLGLAVVPLWGLAPEMRVALAGLVFPLLVLAFRLRGVEYAALLAVMWAVSVWLWTTKLTGLWGAPRGLGGVLWPTLATALYLSVAISLAKSRRQAFLGEWRREMSLDRERSRIRSEIEDARQIQLSMLPRTTPQLPWLDIASVSLPASEVGGDYYAFFELEVPAAPSGEPGAGRGLSIVVGDVAGHGLASGLLLSGLRSCLYLLRNELSSPAVVLEQLDGMVRHTTDRRMLVTLLASFLDPVARRLRLSSAGHPPPLRYAAASGEVEEIYCPALPLGTRLRSHYSEVESPLEVGDLVCFFTDGLTETANGGGEAYGLERLTKILADAASRGRPAREVRNLVLADLSNFKGDVRRSDDVTLVVVRVR